MRQKCAAAAAQSFVDMAQLLGQVKKKRPQGMAGRRPGKSNGHGARAQPWPQRIDERESLRSRRTQARQCHTGLGDKPNRDGVSRLHVVRLLSEWSRGSRISGESVAGLAGRVKQETDFGRMFAGGGRRLLSTSPPVPLYRRKCRCLKSRSAGTVRRGGGRRPGVKTAPVCALRDKKIETSAL